MVHPSVTVAPVSRRTRGMRPRARGWGVALAWLWLSGCGGSQPSNAGLLDAGSRDAGTMDAGTSDSGTPDAGAPPPAAVGQITLDACLGQTGVAERCTLVTNASACTAARCSKLVVVFSGGEMGCDNGTGYANVLAGYAANGYAAVCVNYFDTSTGSAQKPYGSWPASPTT